MRCNEIEARIQELWAAPGFGLRLDPEWASSKENFRTRIREHASASLKPEIDMSDLKVLPSHPAYCVSISHDKQLGGYCYVPLPDRVGFDIEIEDRVSRKLIERVIHEDAEIERAPTPGSLWAAKEAVFKALPKHQQPPTVVDVEIGEWQKFGQNHFRFTLVSLNREKAQQGRGLMFHIKNQRLAFFMITGKT